MRVAVAVPSGDMIHADFATSLFALFSSTRDIETVLINTRCSLIQQSRFILVNTAIQSKADKILFIDSDHTFPPDGLNRLLAHDKPIVGATYTRRRDPWGVLGYGMDAKPITLSEQTTGLQQVALLPLGFMLIDMEVFKAVDRPWFCVGFDVKRDEWASEDYGFCTGARIKGYDIWCDFDISKEIGHIGQQIYWYGNVPTKTE